MMYLTPLRRNSDHNAMENGLVLEKVKHVFFNEHKTISNPAFSDSSVNAPLDQSNLLIPSDREKPIGGSLKECLVVVPKHVYPLAEHLDPGDLIVTEKLCTVMALANPD